MPLRMYNHGNTWRTFFKCSLIYWLKWWYGKIHRHDYSHQNQVQPRKCRSECHTVYFHCLYCIRHQVWKSDVKKTFVVPGLFTGNACHIQPWFLGLSLEGMSCMASGLASSHAAANKVITPSCMYIKACTKPSRHGRMWQWITTLNACESKSRYLFLPLHSIGHGGH